MDLQTGVMQRGRGVQINATRKKEGSRWPRLPAAAACRQLREGVWRSRCPCHTFPCRMLQGLHCLEQHEAGRASTVQFS